MDKKKLVKKITFNQYGSNCGIYALTFAINLHLANNNKDLLTKKKSRKLIGELTKEAVGENRKFSIVGEFFNMNQYKKFINSPEAKEVIEKYVPGLNVDAKLVDRKYYLSHDAPATEDEGLIFAYARTKNTHIVPILEIKNKEVKYINSKKLCTKTLTDRENTKFEVNPYRFKRNFLQRHIIHKTTLIMLFLLILMSSLILLYSNESLLSWYLTHYTILAFSIPIGSAILSYSIIFAMMNFCKIARHEEMRIELRNNKYLKDIPNIKLNKVVKLKFSNQRKISKAVDSKHKCLL